MAEVAKSIEEQVLPHFGSHFLMVDRFGEDAAGIVEGAAAGAAENQTAEELTAVKFKHFKNSLEPAVAIVAEMLIGTMFDTYNAEFLELAQKQMNGTPLTYQEYFMTEPHKTDGGKAEKTSETGTGLLKETYATFAQACISKAPVLTLRTSCSDDPTQQTAPEDVFGISLDEDEQNVRDATWTTVCDHRRKKVALHEPGNIPKIMQKAALKAMFVKSRFSGQGTATGVQKKGTKPPLRLFLLSPEIFGGFKTNPRSAYCLDYSQVPEVTQELQETIAFIAETKQNSDMVAIFDGRAKGVRRYVEDQMQDKFGDVRRHSDAWLIFDQPKHEPRVSNRKYAFSAQNREVLHLALPSLKNKIKVQAREFFKLCGELTTYHVTYSGVQVKSLSQTPRLTEADWKAITGQPLATPREKVVDEVNHHGLPLYWSDWKPIDFYVSIYQDLGGHRGSGPKRGARICSHRCQFCECQI